MITRNKSLVPPAGQRPQMKKKVGETYDVYMNRIMLETGPQQEKTFMKYGTTVDCRVYTDSQCTIQHIIKRFKHILYYSPFHKTLLRSSFQMQWISVRFYEMGDIKIFELVSYIKYSKHVEYNHSTLYKHKSFPTNT